MKILSQRQSGIYKIVNTVNGKFYIGSAMDFYVRLHNHKSELKRNVHPNCHLQRAWNKYGEGVFVCSVLEFCDKNKLTEREQYYIDTLKPQYNILPNARSSFGRRMSQLARNKIRNFFTGRALSNAHKANISKAVKGHVKTDTHRKNLSKSLMGHSFTDETRRKMSEAQKRRFAKTPCTDEFRKQRSEAAKARWAKRRDK